MKEIIINNLCRTRVLIQNKIDIRSQVSGFNKVLVVSDNNVFKIYGEDIIKKLIESNKYVFKFIIKAGEESKNIENALNITKFLAENSFCRNDLVLTFGGGVVGDLGGFAASIYKRGTKLFHVPTTLLSAVDASVGGKTGVNAEYGKNMLGTFYNPLKVIVNTSYLSTLSQKEINCGKAEIFKYAFIKETKILDLVKMSDLESVIEASVNVKKFFIEEDEFDCGRRMTLNFGHTIGHAVEKSSNYKISHGEAVSIGMAAMARHFGVSEIESILKENGLPIIYKEDTSRLIKFMMLDKKRSGDMYSIVAPIRLGECVIVQKSKEEIREILKRVKG